jgi:hypothetical protein
MKDILSSLDALRRPRLLLQAARIGAADYRRSVQLPRQLGTGPLPRSGPALMALMEMEAEMDARRRSGDARYVAARHVEVMIAMLGEARLLRATRRQGSSEGVR